MYVGWGGGGAYGVESRVLGTELRGGWVGTHALPQEVMCAHREKYLEIISTGRQLCQDLPRPERYSCHTREELQLHVSDKTRDRTEKTNVTTAARTKEQLLAGARLGEIKHLKFAKGPLYDF